ncbi:cytochrome b5-like heme/steroid binding domain-containing protein [Schaalia sp. JY-X159]|jgi:cytochrome b involved in lipid metabolism|uniref:cytochrome b5-like heme/steroid binding domain-containing protein n=1 Tax=Schaalia sp. JY-X159 TaxID=2758575 RepID=UPI00165E564A|nr:cytochrome b5-like heme/steroid binding domain-containing protein [Schaalia sp. JY-X159]
MGGLPLHPLVVHAPVVLIPLSAIALVLLIFVRKWRPHYAWLAVAGLVVGTLGAVAAVLTGNAFAETIGLPARHATLGTILVWTAAALSVSAIVWWLLQHQERDNEQESRIVWASSIVTVVLVVATLIFTVLTGHSGAEAAWGGTTSQSESTAVEDEKGTVEDEQAAESQSASPATTFTAAQVAQNSDATSCWASVDGSVYDLTEWISEHPGGSREIEALCGTDATAAFQRQHGSNAEAQRELAGFKIGELG